MTMTTSAPRWVNIDELVSRGLRAEMAAFTERVSTYGASGGDTHLAESLDRRWHDAIHDSKGVPDEIFLTVMEWTGYTAFDDARIAAGIDPE
jgi:hypothetical protein